VLHFLPGATSWFEPWSPLLCTGFLNPYSDTSWDPFVGGSDHRYGFTLTGQQTKVANKQLCTRRYSNSESQCKYPYSFYHAVCQCFVNKTEPRNVYKWHIYIYIRVGVLISLWLFLFAAQPKAFSLNGLKKLEQRSRKCVELMGNM
jgi:hypothetical protein